MIKLERIVIPAAKLGAANPLPDIRNNTYIHAPIQMTDKISKDEAKNIGKGMIPTLLPYLAQDNYDRERTPQEFAVVVLENDYLRAEFLPELGGRLRRLYDKEAKQELLYVNPVFQPCNLALRNAWFSGGVEFNVGIKGHNPLTCSPVFAEKRVDENGEEYVSFYEYERIRGVVWSVNAYLPEHARALTLRCCIENCSEDEKYMYWWSNIAVPEDKNTRVIVPAHEMFVNYFGEDSYVLDKASVPNAFDTDASYPANLSRSLDFFYKIPTDKKKWIASAKEDGSGLLHFSDERLYGRKMFLWGQAAGGRHWGEYLAEPGDSYIEIQAGLAHTQLEHFLMPGKSKIEWVEGYAPLRCTHEQVYGEWDMAIEAVEKQLSEIDAAEPPQLTAIAELKEREMLFRGSGWGSLEMRVSGQPISNYFSDWTSEDVDTKEWEGVLERGVLPEHSIDMPPRSYVTGRFWEKKLRSMILAKETNYYTYLQLGVTLYELGCKGDKVAMDECVAMWKKSVQVKPNPWAYRNLAAFYANECKDYQRAVGYAMSAVNLLKDNRNLAVDCGQILLNARQYEQWIDVSKTFTDDIAESGRIRLLRAKALLALNRLEEAAEIVNSDFEMPDIKEGELSISELWFELKAKSNGISMDEAKKKYSLPYQLDFRIHG